jgi:integrase
MADEWKASSLVRVFYQVEFRPQLVRRLGVKRREQYETALRRFEKFVGGRPRLGDLTHDRLLEFKRWLPSRRVTKSTARNYAGCVRAIAKAWRGELVPRIEPLPPARPGTLRHYFEHTYKHEAMFNCKPDSVAMTERAIRKLYRHLGRDVELVELCDSLIANFLKSLLESGMAAATVNTRRAPLLAVWNHAFHNRLIDRAPRVRKAKEIRNPPEAWNVKELRELLAAARRFRPGECYGSIPCDRWWAAVLMIAYDTALRRGSLMAIRRDNIDLASRILRVDGVAMKNLRGQIFRLSVQTTAAIADIWQSPRELLFGGLAPRTQYKHFALIIESAGIRRHRRKGMNLFHALRRSTATLVAAAAGVGAASSLLGHSDPYVSARYIAPEALQLDVTKILPSLAAG